MTIDLQVVAPIAVALVSAVGWLVKARDDDRKRHDEALRTERLERDKLLAEAESAHFSTLAELHRQLMALADERRKDGLTMLEARRQDAITSSATMLKQAEALAVMSARLAGLITDDEAPPPRHGPKEPKP